MTRTLYAMLTFTLAAGTLAAGDVGFVEDFALSPDRPAALRQLIPGTDDYYYYHALHALNTEQFEAAVRITGPWHDRHGQTARLTEIQTRHALLTYERDPKKALEYLRSRLNLQFNHRKETPGAIPDLPTALDPKRVSRETLRADSLNRWTYLENFEDAGLDQLPAANLTWERKRTLLQRTARPDRPDLVKLISDDLAAQNPPGFGAYPIHGRLTTEQLVELLRLRPELIDQPAYVTARIVRLLPGADQDYKRDRNLALGYLDRLQAYVDTLGPVYNSLNAHTLYHRLALDRARGVFDKERFLAYLKLPRMQPYMARELNDAPESQRHPAGLDVEHAGYTGLTKVGSDEELVRAYLKHFLLDAADPKAFYRYIDNDYLKHLFAEVKIENGLGDADKWAADLPPETFRAFKDRVDIDFAATNPTEFAADAPVRLDLFVKNVPNLIVKVFEINTTSVYRTSLREVDTDINLDGLVANRESAFPYGDAPTRRVARRFEFPELAKPGVYVVDFIGAGKSSRALVRKGKLRPVVTQAAGGQAVTVVDEANKPVADAVVWLGGREYKTVEGVALIPFSTAPGRRPVVVSKGDFACLDSIDHTGETYQLSAGIHVDRESLLATRVTPIVVRPGLTLNGRPASVTLLEEVLLRVTSVDQSGVPTTVDVPNFQLFEDRESTYEIRVPARLAALTVQLTAKVKSLTAGKPVDVAASRSFALNGIAKSERVEDLHLARFGDIYTVEVLGRTGETRADRACQFTFKHREFKEPVRVSLKSDAAGRIALGPLPDITSITATGPDGAVHVWPLTGDRHTFRRVVHAKAGDIVRVPHLGTAAKPTPAEYALFEVRGDVIRADRFDALSVKNGMLELAGLAAGDYELDRKETGEKTLIRVVAGPAAAGHVLGAIRDMRLPGLAPVQISGIGADEAGLTVAVANANSFTRVHVFATRYRPEFDAFNNLAAVRDAELDGVYPGFNPSSFLTGRNIGDEYRYVLDRRGQPKVAGNMLARPQLLLNPWAVRTTVAGVQEAQAGEDFSGRGGMTPPAAAAPPSPKMDAAADAASRARSDSPDLDFLMDGSAIALNLVPDKDGIVRLPREKLGPHAMIHVVAIDPLTTTARTVPLPEVAAKKRDLRFAAGFEAAKHFTQQKKVTVLEPGKAFTLADLAGSRYEGYDSLAKVYTLFTTLSHDPKLAEFAFLPRWDKIDAAEKKTLYAKYACHELHLFLAKKDVPFFNEVVKPYLANKKDKTFIDQWLLDADLGRFAEPWAYSRLNAAERVLYARRVPGEAAKTSRHINDLLKLSPTPADRLLQLFDTAVNGRSLGVNDEVQLKRAERFRADGKELADAAKDAPAIAGATGGFGGGGFGGGGGMVGGGPGNAPAPAGPMTMGMPAKPGEPGRPRAKMSDRDTDGAAEKKMEQMTRKQESEKLGKMMESESRAGDMDDKRKDNYFGRRAGMSARELYRPVEATQEWAENNYYHLPIAAQTADLIPVSPFWADYAAHDGKTPFLSTHFAEAGRNASEMILALAALDLPFTPGKHDVKFDGAGMTVTPATPIIAFHEEVRPAEPLPGPVPVLVSQNLYRQGDRFRVENGETTDKFATGEFVTHAAYGCQVVVTNPSSTRQKLTVLVQIPTGALPLANGQYTKTVPLDLEPYRTMTVDYLFYFPKPGSFAHYPAQIAKAEKFVAAPAAAVLTVVDKPTTIDKTTWEYVSQNGTTEEVLAYLDRENVRALNLDKIAFRMSDRGAFEAVTKLLRDRHLYQPTLWSYAVVHADLPAAREFFAHADQIVNECGGPIVSPLLTIDAVARHRYEHLEYKPLVNARAHSLGARRQIVNDRFHQQYHQFLYQLQYARTLSDADQLGAAYYLLLQDRVPEAAAAFAKVNPDRVPSKLQYDYCGAYLAVSADDPAKARAVAMKYVNHPVDRWRTAFTTLAAHLDEAEGKGPAAAAGADDAGGKQGQLAATEPSFEFVMDGPKAKLTWQNLETVRVNYYLMDVELLFSRSPFVSQGGGQFAAIRPNATAEVKLPAGQSKFDIALPADLAKRNVLVEITAGGQTRTQAYYANAMTVNLTEAYGQLKVTDAAGGKPLPKAYVKVYVRAADGGVKFHKDGYTDARGRFDYATVSTPELSPPQRFAVLVLSDDKGATIREATPPQR